MQKTKFLPRIYVTILLLMTLSINVFAQMGEIQGRVTGVQTDKGIPFASIHIIDGCFSQIIQTDENGFYAVKFLPPSSYKFYIYVVGYEVDIVEKVLVIADQVTEYNIAIYDECKGLCHPIIRRYKIPLLNPYYHSTGSTLSYNNERRMPIKVRH